MEGNRRESDGSVMVQTQDWGRVVARVRKVGGFVSIFEGRPIGMFEDKIANGELGRLRSRAERAELFEDHARSG